jgi:hypothetical protein
MESPCLMVRDFGCDLAVLLLINGRFIWAVESENPQNKLTGGWNELRASAP